MAKLRGFRLRKSNSPHSRSIDVLPTPGDFERTRQPNVSSLAPDPSPPQRSTCVDRPGLSEATSACCGVHQVSRLIDEPGHLRLPRHPEIYAGVRLVLRLASSWNCVIGTGGEVNTGFQIHIGCGGVRVIPVSPVGFDRRCPCGGRCRPIGRPRRSHEMAPALIREIHFCPRTIPVEIASCAAFRNALIRN